MKIKFFASIGLGALYSFLSPHTIKADNLQVLERFENREMEGFFQIPINPASQKVTEQKANTIEEYFSLAAAKADKIENIEEKIKFVEEIQNKTLSLLPELLPSKIKEYLNELSRFYLRTLPQIHIKLEHRNYLIELAKPQYELLFQMCLNDIADNDERLQKIGLENLKALSEIIPWGDATEIGKITGANIVSKQFFYETLQKSVRDEKELQVFIDTGFLLWKLTSTELNDYPDKFAMWLTTQLESTLDNNPENQIDNLKKQKVLLGGITKLLDTKNISFAYLQELSPNKKNKLLLPLITSYTKLVKENGLSPEELINATKGFIMFKTVAKSYPTPDLIPMVSEELKEALSSLFEVICDGVNNLPPDSRNITTREFLRYIQYELQTLPTDLFRMDFLITSISKHFFKQNDLDITELSNLIGLLCQKKENKENNAFYTKFPAYFILSIVIDNKDNISKIIEDGAKKLEETSNTDEQFLLMGNLTNLFELLHNIPELISFSDQSPVESKDLRKEAKKYFLEKIKGPIVHAFVARLQNENVKITTNDREHHINNRTWKELNKKLATLYELCPEVSSDVLNAVNKRLLTETNPYNREMCYETLGVILAEKNENYKNIPLRNVLRNGLIDPDEPPQAIRGIGLALANGITHEVEKGTLYPPQHDHEYDESKGTENEIPYLTYTDLFNLLGNYAEGSTRFESLQNLEKERQTETQRLIVHGVRLLEWDFELAKTYLSGSTFETERKKDFESFQKVQHNFYIALAHSAAHQTSEKNLDLTYKYGVIKTLENKFNFYTDPESWGEKTAVLVELYSSLPITKKEDFVKERLEFVRNQLESYEDRLLHYHMQTSGDFREPLSLSDVEQRKLKEKLGVKKEMDRLKKIFAKKFLACAPSESLALYREYLVKIGCNSYDDDNSSNKS